jgi:acyl-CoA synthetase (AMP-forming)/AMP-acid ligase II
VIPETIPALLAERCRSDADRSAIVTLGERLTYAELDDASSTVAARLVATGVGKGDRVALLAANGTEWATLAFAALRIGAVLVPLSTLLRPPELLAQLTIADVAHLIVAPEFRDRRYLEDLDAAASGLVATITSGRRHAAAPSLRAIRTTDEVLHETEPTDPAAADVVSASEDLVTPGDDLCVLFTSGSSGTPKGVIHTHGGAIRAVAAGLEARGVHHGERLYIPMPFFWTGGFSGGLLTALVAGATLLTESEPEPSRTLALLERERATLFRGWPDQADRLAAHPDFAATDLSTLRDASLPAVLPPECRPAPGARSNLFGMTESFGPYCGDPLDLDMPRDEWGSCGRPFTDVEVQIADPETAVVLPPGEPGEIHLRGPNLLRGICGRSRTDVFTVEGWFRTGDLGRLDDAGYLWYSGRVDDMVKVKGATVYPNEVEAALRSIPDVRAAHVTDVVDGDGRPEVAAMVVTGAPIDDLRTAVRERLSAFKVPTRWLTTDDATAVPMLASGKVDKAALRRLLAERGASALPDPASR